MQPEFVCLSQRYSGGHSVLTKTRGPVFCSGDMWSAWDEADLFLVTTNAVITQAGKLVMGAGIAKEARDRFPGVDTAFARVIKQQPDPARYGLLVSARWPTAKLGAFQVKADWRDPGSLDIISYSLGMLIAWCAEHPQARVHLNMPGVGNGRLSLSDVQPRLSTLPESVTVWTKPARPKTGRAT